MINLKLFSFLILFNLIFIDIAISQKVHKPTGFTYTGELFQDPEWGWSYNTSEQDRIVLARTNKIIIAASKNLIENPGDYNTSIYDMSFAFDPQKQKESKANGSKCVTCYYSHNPNTGEHFQYEHKISLELIENTESYLKKHNIDDSLSKLIISISEKRRNSATGNEKKLKEEMEKLQKEIENMDMSNIDERKLAEIEEKSKRIKTMGDENEKSQTISDDTLHAMYGCSYSLKSDLLITTNTPLLNSEKNNLQQLKNKNGFYYKEINIPGCDFACIYFDMYKKSDKFQYSSYPTFIAYIGRLYNNKNELPKPWVNPYCVRITFSGNLPQINECYKKIDFVKLKEIISN
ncbi:MAG: hypothetical protein IT243_00785 [Bacteroidia bacterium]|nr:hypothetical protein [Bacteroidia bacterium]